MGRVFAARTPAPCHSYRITYVRIDHPRYGGMHAANLPFLVGRDGTSSAGGDRLQTAGSP